MSQIPEGFAPHFRKSPVTDPWEPLFSRRQPASVDLGLLVAEAHCNSRGMLHGGVIAALADNAMGLSVSAAAEAQGHGLTRLVTVSLAIDYVAAAKIGQWLCVTPRVVKTGRTLGFADALVTAEGQTIARASASFAVAAG